QVLVRASVTFHELYGLSLQIVDIDPRYTLGDLARLRRETIARLEQEGVFEMNRELDRPAVIQRIAVVSSRNAAGYQDFMQELARSPYRFEVELFDAFMQGDAAEASIIDALGRAGERWDEFDAVVMIRGGGSQSDLGCFDSYRLCSHVAQFPLPVITGIGHDKDRSVADQVAFASLKTPTAVAGWLIEGMEEFDRYIETLAAQVEEFAAATLDGQRGRLQTAGYELARIATRLTHGLELRLERLADALAHGAAEMLRRRSERTERADGLLRERVPALLSQCAARLDLLGERVDARRPDRILAMGFSIVRGPQGAVTDSRKLKAGEQVEITMLHGYAQATINSTDNGKK
ncbi:MAG: exodeoxyribonuclease VII large subunit, partial [Rikenellaceae bacterium]|nr:exodeoxyribonuclease VII large subunit [Rikenellaceae bacterium]